MSARCRCSVARVRDRVHAVEGVGEIDEPALRPDRGDRVGEGQAARDLLAQEEADHLALAVGLDLLAGDDRRACGRGRARPPRAAPPKRLWSVTAIAPSPIASAWSSRLADLGSSSRATRRCACAGRRGSTARSASGSPSRRAMRRRPGEARGRARRARRRRSAKLWVSASLARLVCRASRGARSFSASRATAAAASSGWLVDAGRGGGGGSGGCRLEPRAAGVPSAPGRRSPPRARTRARLPRRGRAVTCARGAASAPRDVRPARAAAASAAGRAPSRAARRGSRITARATGRSTGAPLEHDQLPLRPGRGRGSVSTPGERTR